jgi:kinesin family protein 14
MLNSAARSKSPKSTSLNKLPTSSKPKMTGTKQKVASAGASKDPKIDPSKERKKKTKVQPSFNSRIKVAVRLRPKTTKEEAEKEEPVIFVDGSNIQLLTNIGETFFFTCDGCFTSDSISAVAQNKHQQQREVYENLAKPLLSQAFQGFNTCLFAYGQTGSGKSYSMMGKIGSKSELADASGIIPRFCQDFFIHVDDLVKNYAETSVSLSIEVQISYFEIYKEQIQDLLCSTGGNLSVREHPKNVGMK